jgi:hypothetical protein
MGVGLVVCVLMLVLVAKTPVVLYAVCGQDMGSRHDDNESTPLSSRPPGEAMTPVPPEPNSSQTTSTTLH